MSIFGDLERFAADLYPYRWPITIALAVAVGAAAVIAIRMRWHLAVVRHWLLSLAIAVPLIAVMTPVAWYTLSPLWERSYLDEASPLAAAPLSTATSLNTSNGVGQPTIPAAATEPALPTVTAPMTVPPTATAEPASALPRLTSMGTFLGADDFHFGRGNAQIIETAPGVYTLRFEEFSVRNGPDLYVYLTPDPSGQSIDGAVNLGSLKATDGAFNYEIPVGTDISQFGSAIVWCRQAGVLFAHAELMEG